MRFDVLTLHPGLVAGPLEHSILRRAQDAGYITVGVHDLREHGVGRYRQVDDAPYGGGAGMVLKVDVIDQGIEAVRREDSRVILMSPAGARFDQGHARRLACGSHLILVCGHYEGVDARVESLVDEQLSIGDYVLTGGELPALVVIEAVARLVPGVLGNSDSFQDESFAEGLLEYPQYTRPRSYRGLDVPDVLLSGNHAAIDAWRDEQALARTRERRPDLLEASTEDP
ncbi:MAG: tRNA (guanosine(37)-N1)-methyltransferase TrmD [Alphaproteobacteria bacterium]|nr:tRNA (guanosine(37)-N1)-methyltransferase TrmD [Alphaproteobacteria bacterium]